MKLNVITKDPEIVKAIHSVKDGRFIEGDIKKTYGYLTNLKNPEICSEYERYKQERKELFPLSDEERFHFDTLMVRKYRANICEAIDEIERREGSNLAQRMEKCSGVEFIYDPATKDNQWLIKTSTESIRESNPILAIGLFTDKINAALQRRAKSYCEKNGLNPYTGEAK